MTRSTTPVRQRTFLPALLLAAVAPAAATPCDASAQALPGPGDRVRIYSVEADTALEGRLLTLNGSGLAYEPPGGRSVQLDPVSVRSIQVARVKRYWGAGLTAGLFAGAVAGAILKPTDKTIDCNSAVCDQTFGDNNERFFSAVLGAAAGGLGGTVIGWFFRSESWQPVMVPWNTAGSGGAEIGTRLSF